MGPPGGPGEMISWGRREFMPAGGSHQPPVVACGPHREAPAPATGLETKLSQPFKALQPLKALSRACGGSQAATLSSPTACP